MIGRPFRNVHVPVVKPVKARWMFPALDKRHRERELASAVVEGQNVAPAS